MYQILRGKNAGNQLLHKKEIHKQTILNKNTNQSKVFPSGILCPIVLLGSLVDIPYGQANTRGQLVQRLSLGLHWDSSLAHHLNRSTECIITIVSIRTVLNSRPNAATV